MANFKCILCIFKIQNTVFVFKYIFPHSILYLYLNTFFHTVFCIFILNTFWCICAHLCWLHCEYLQHISVFGCVVSICSTFLYLVALWVFAAHFCIWLRCGYLQRISVFLLSIYSAFLYLVALWVFAAHFCIWFCWVFTVHFCIWLCWEFLQWVSVLGSLVSICSVFLYSVVLWDFAARFCIWFCWVLTVHFCIWLRCEYLQRIYVFGFV